MKDKAGHLRRLFQLAFVIAILTAPADPQSLHAKATEAASTGLHVLLVVAHPDDEYEMAATIYRITRELSGKVDQLIITDGAAGYHYSSLAEQYYGVRLTDESDGRKELPRIRREEARRAARVLGIDHEWFLNEKDERFTLDAQEVLEKSWHQDRVRKSILQRLQHGHYTYVLVLLPIADTHGAHKAASLLALEAVKQLSPDDRPVVLGALAANTATESYEPLPQYPITTAVSQPPALHFDRDAHFGYQNSLNYQIVVDWVIAEHKSQGLFQNRCRQDRFENFWAFRVGRDLPVDSSQIFSSTSYSSAPVQQVQAATPGHRK
jgi:LmbE family N-acetylglucosaminyl deacetylase